MNRKMTELLQNMPKADSAAFLEDARREAKTIQIPQTAWCKAHGFKSEKEYKAVMARKGGLMYHTHFCFPSREAMVRDMTRLEGQLAESGVVLDRFGVSLDPSMALPATMRQDAAAHNGLYLNTPDAWVELASFSFSQPHLGDNMIGSPASFESCCSALRAGVTTMGNISQFFGWDYPEFPDTEARTRSAVMAMAVMGEHRADGTLVHSNLDDGYGDKCGDMGQLIGMALIEKYIAEDLLGAKVAHSFGDMFHSPYKRLVFLAALKQIHGDEAFGSMVFTNKLGRAKGQIGLNDAHLCTYLLFDMAGQVYYQTGHAVTVMADCGLDDQVTNEEIVRKLALARELEAYVPEVLHAIDFCAVDQEAADLVARGTQLKDNMLDYLNNFIDVKDPYIMMLAIKTAGVKNLVEELSDTMNCRGVMLTDYQLYSH